MEVFEWENNTAKPEVQLVIDRCFSSKKRPTKKKAAIRRPPRAAAQIRAAPERRRGDRHRVSRIPPAATWSARRSSATTARRGDQLGAVPLRLTGSARGILLAGPGHALLRPGQGRARGAGPKSRRSPSRTSLPPRRRARPSSADSNPAPGASSGPRRRRRTQPLWRPWSARRIPLSPLSVRAALAATARPVGAFGPNAVGAGLVDAYAAVKTSPCLRRSRSLGPPAPRWARIAAEIGFAANRPVTFSCYDRRRRLPALHLAIHPRPARRRPARLRRARHRPGRANGASETVSFTVDTVARAPSSAKHPRKTDPHPSRAGPGRVPASAPTSPASTFVCRVDGGLFRFCPSALRGGFAVGRARRAGQGRRRAGNVDETPAVFRFKVKRVG